MYAITGITGQVGGAVADSLLKQGLKVRAILRNRDKAREWETKGCEVAIGDFNEPASLAAAFSGVQGGFVMIPANFAPGEGFPETRAVIASLKQALTAARPPKIVCLSSIGAHRSSGLGLITQLNILETELEGVGPSVAFVRPGWFMENSLWDVASAKTTGEIRSFLFPLDKTVPMIATADIGKISAGILAQDWKGRRITEMEGPQRYSPNDLAKAFSKSLARPVRAVALPREQWEAFFRAQAPANPKLRMEMLDGLNSGWIAFEGSPAEHVTGQTGLESVIDSLVARA